jgi:hypothetical protein
MPKQLLDRQHSLLEYLTSSPAIFGDDSSPTTDPLLRGIDPELLHLEARFSHEKRMDKIRGVFSLTFAQLGGNRTTIERSFAETCQPTSIGRLENARQFYVFVTQYWHRETPKPRYLPDLAACEFAIAEARGRAIGADPAGGVVLGQRATARRGPIRRGAGVVLLRCAYDVRGMFDIQANMSAPASRDVALAVVIPPGMTEPELFGLDPAVFDLLAALDTWTTRSLFGRARRSARLISSLVGCGLLEENE